MEAGHTVVRGLDGGGLHVAGRHNILYVILTLCNMLYKNGFRSRKEFV